MGNHSLSTFLDEFSQFLDETMYRPSPLVITGDLNIHFDNTSAPNTLRFNDLISGHGISQLVSSPTHDKGHILDVIMVRNSDNVLYSSPKVFYGISDHSAVSCLLKFVRPSRVMSEFTCRNIKKINRTAFAEDIVSCKLMSSPTDSVDCVVENYNSALSRLLNIHAPAKTRKIRKRTDCPWYNSDIAAAKRKRRRLERKWLSNGKSEIDRKLLCAQKNVVNSLLKKAKRSYYVGLIEDCGEDSKRLFSVANRLLNRKQSSPLPSHTDSSAMAETFIDYFRNKVETISNSLCPDESAQEPLTTASLETLKPTDPDEVQALLRRLPPKSCSLDPVPTDAVANPKDAMAGTDCSSQLVCGRRGIYPKEEDAKGIGQFRPISLLNVDGKILFSVLARRLSEFAVKNTFVDTSVQKAGIPGFSGCTEHVQMIWESIQRCKHEKDVDVIWMDLANAYESVPHRYLSFALEFFWVPRVIREMVQSYYSQFRMRFMTQTYTTEWQALEIGIPMGCLVSPLLFVLGIEVLTRCEAPRIEGLTLAADVVVPSIRVFIDDLTIVSGNETQIEDGLHR
ncbi:uncharacterized protein [Diadema antillarum]|uniref:uncharacterized protein n=1 Tax=Diadema antillarum TaxID=105358 RepID=UPI003A840716